MLTKLFAGGALIVALATSIPQPQATSAPTVATYNTLADAILAIKHTESNFVRSMLDAHYNAAMVAVERGDHQQAAAEMALFANEGDNAIGGVRKRLLEGGHHHNAAGEAKGIYEPGYVIVTREAKMKALGLSAKMRAAGDDVKAVWTQFEALAQPLLSAD